MAKKYSYQELKAKAREKAIFWQSKVSNEVMDWYSIASWGAYFERLAKRFGLIREFRENGII